MKRRRQSLPSYCQSVSVHRTAEEGGKRRGKERRKQKHCQFCERCEAEPSEEKRDAETTSHKWAMSHVYEAGLRLWTKCVSGWTREINKTNVGETRYRQSSMYAFTIHVCWSEDSNPSCVSLKWCHCGGGEKRHRQSKTFPDSSVPGEGAGTQEHTHDARRSDTAAQLSRTAEEIPTGELEDGYQFT